MVESVIEKHIDKITNQLLVLYHISGKKEIDLCLFYELLSKIAIYSLHQKKSKKGDEKMLTNIFNEYII